MFIKRGDTIPDVKKWRQACVAQQLRENKEILIYQTNGILESTHNQRQHFMNPFTVFFSKLVKAKKKLIEKPNQIDIQAKQCLNNRNIP